MRDWAGIFGTVGVMSCLFGSVAFVLWWLRRRSRIAARVFRDDPIQLAIVLGGAGAICLLIAGLLAVAG